MNSLVTLTLDEQGKVKYHKDMWNEKDYSHEGLGKIMKTLNGDHLTKVSYTFEVGRQEIKTDPVAADHATTRDSVERLDEMTRRCILKKCILPSMTPRQSA